MEDAVKVISAKFNLSVENLNKVGNESEDISAWLTVLGAYVLDNDKKQEEQKTCENNLRKQRLNAGKIVIFLGIILLQSEAYAKNENLVVTLVCC